MRLHRFAAIAAFVWIPAAQAATMVWFETPNANGNGGVVWPGGSQGTTLGLFCDTSAPSGMCTWQIQMKTALGPGGVVGWSLDLRTAPGNGVSVVNPQTPSGTPFNNSAFAGTGGTGAALLSGAHGQTFVPQQPQTLTLLTFTLRKSFQTGDLASWWVFGGPSLDGSVVWTNDSTGDYEVVQFGPNPPMPGFEGNLGILPVIANYIPEPASLALMALGAAVCMRRRRGRQIGGGA